MNRRTALTLALCALAAAPPALAAPGWRALFDGRSLDAWAQVGDANWRIVDGSVQADAGGGVLVSKEDFGDFQLRAEVWVEYGREQRHLHTRHRPCPGDVAERLRGEPLRYSSGP